MRRALVTGAGRGLGLEFTRQLLSRGDQVFAGLRNPAGSEALQTLAETHGAQLQMVALDISKTSSIAACHDAVAARVDGLDLLVNNAGINSRSRGIASEQRNVAFGRLEPDGILQMVRVNAVGPLLLTQAMADLLAVGVRPRVAHISSWLGSVTRKTSAGNYGYCASKAALNMVTRILAHDLLPRGVLSVTFTPGWVQTDMGGPDATLTPVQSVGGILSVIERLGDDDAGKFLQWDGSEHPW